MITVKESDIAKVVEVDDDAMLTLPDEVWDPAKDYFGVKAKITLRIPFGQDFILVPIETPGLWGIDSNEDDPYLDEVFEEEKETLIQILNELSGIKVEE